MKFKFKLAKFKYFLLKIFRTILRELYHLDVIYKNKIIKPSNLIKVAAPLFPIIIIAYLFNNSHTISNPDLKKIYTALGSLFLIGISWLLIRYLSNKLHSGGISSDDFIFPGKYVIIRTKGRFHLRTSQIDDSYFKFPTPQQITDISQLNVRAFRNSVWADSFVNKYKRNNSHFKKNKTVLMLIVNEESEPIGYTHIIPVNEKKIEDYLNGEIGDTEFTSELVSPLSTIFEDEKADMLLVFSIAFVKKDITLKSKNVKFEIGNLLEAAFAYHINHIITSHDSLKDRKSIKVLLQTKDQRYLKHLRKNIYKSDKISNENIEFSHFFISNKH
ncbi:hypothetical protein [Flavobacterium wongokense]|uniref:hypothetical protein n=1 Tax=Flavobacterium wongokense TaxID=2910674 RepID=UPI001F16C219|nr:hypothetical protein [Flavobacterium sp. WG47]MCF6132507.1 hypothetical protein [Flavobacterium sp. WG47]